MANEARVTSALSIQRDNLNYNVQGTFLADVSMSKGPRPGGVTVNADGIDIDFGTLVIPSLCRIAHVDGTDRIEYGIRAGTTWYPVGELLPGESYVLRLSRNLGEQGYTTGTGTTGTIHSLHLRSTGGVCEATVEAFEL
jgi:hypothetical protein